MVEMQSRFVLADREKCIGCRACELACFVAHSEAAGATVGTVEVPIATRLFLTTTAQTRMPVQCHHCEDAPCLAACATGAISREDRAIVLDSGRCVGCKNCLLACPFGSIELTATEDTTPFGAWRFACVKCDLCRGEQPACAAACPNDALRIVDAAEELPEKRIRAAQALALESGIEVV